MRNPAWGSPYTCARGEKLEEWSMMNNLILLNKGNTPTCTRPQGDSFIDTSWASANLFGYIQNWIVKKDVMTYSDHNYIQFSIGDKNVNRNIEVKQCRNRQRYPRWIYKDLDTELIEETIEWYCSTSRYKNKNDIGDLNDATHWIKQTMTEASDTVMKRVKNPQKKKQTYWWNNQIKDARSKCVEYRRKWTKEKRRKIRDMDRIETLRKEYKTQKKILSKEIYKAKENSWKMLIDTINEDPWGIPYKIIIGKLRNNNFNLTETLKNSELNILLTDLFPRNKHKEASCILSLDSWKEEWEVTEAEVSQVIKERECPTTAPGPDGIINKVWKWIPDDMILILSNIFTECIKKGEFPALWKNAKLVLIPKSGELQQGIPKARPICLIDEIGKALERIITRRIHKWIEDRQKDNFWTLSNNQYGFRKNKSTTDLLLKVRQISRR